MWRQPKPLKVPQKKPPRLQRRRVLLYLSFSGLLNQTPPLSHSRRKRHSSERVPSSLWKGELPSYGSGEGNKDRACQGIASASSPFLFPLRRRRRQGKEGRDVEKSPLPLLFARPRMFRAEEEGGGEAWRWRVCKSLLLFSPFLFLLDSPPPPPPTFPLQKDFYSRLSSLLHLFYLSTHGGRVGRGGGIVEEGNSLGRDALVLFD